MIYTVTKPKPFTRSKRIRGGSIVKATRAVGRISPGDLAVTMLDAKTDEILGWHFISGAAIGGTNSIMDLAGMYEPAVAAVAPLEQWLTDSAAKDERGRFDWKDLARSFAEFKTKNDLVACAMRTSLGDPASFQAYVQMLVANAISAWPAELDKSAQRAHVLAIVKGANRSCRATVHFEPGVEAAPTGLSELSFGLVLTALGWDPDDAILR